MMQKMLQLTLGVLHVSGGDPDYYVLNSIDTECSPRKWR